MLRTFDSLWDSPFRALSFGPGRTVATATGTPAVPLDVLRHDDRLTLVFDLPGVDPDTIELTVDKRELTLTAERTTTVDESGTFITRQRPHGQFTRRLYLGDELDADRLEADYDLGVLTVTVPLAESAKPRKVAIGAGTGAPAIDPADES